MANQVRWGIIGLGNIARKFAHDLLLVENAVLAGVASRNVDKANQFAEEFQAQNAYSDYQSMLEDPTIDVVYIATPHVFHFEHTMLCLQAGKHVLCEKPFGINRHEVELMIQEAQSRNLFLMEALWTRFIPATNKMLELIESGIIGDIEYVRADFGFARPLNPEGRLHNLELGGGSLMDIGIYPIYFSLLLLGLPSKIKAVAQFTSTGVDSLCAMLFDYDSGQKALLESTIHSFTKVEACVYGSKGSICLEPEFHHSEAVRLHVYRQDEVRFEFQNQGFGYYYEILEVNACLSEKKLESPKMSHQMSLDIIETLDQVRNEIGLVYPNDKKSHL